MMNRLKQKITLLLVLFAVCIFQAFYLTAQSDFIEFGGPIEFVEGTMEAVSELLPLSAPAYRAEEHPDFVNPGYMAEEHPIFVNEADWETPWEQPDKRPVDYPDVTIETFYTPPQPVTSPFDEPVAVAAEPEEETEEKAEEKKAEAEGKPSYRLKIGDQLLISLYGFREARTDRVVVVDPTGSISYLFVNRVFALGKSIDEVRKDIEDKVKLQYPHVIVTATALNLTGDTYTIMGEVNMPGTKPVTGNSTVLSAVAQAGGFPLRAFRSQTIDYADLNRAFLARDGEYVPVDFEKLIKGGDLSQDVHLQGGDYIYIPSLVAKEIYVLGEVNRPFVYTYMETASLAEVITWARGLTLLASSRIAVIRGSLSCPTTYLIDVNLIFKGCRPDFLLCPGDIVYAPARRFESLREIVKQAFRIFVGAAATQAGENAFIHLYPKSANFLNNNNNVFINPGLIPAPAPPVIIAP